MYDVSCKLLFATLKADEIGVQKEEIIETEIPIIKIEDVRANEFYSANQAGYKPSLRLIINTLNYDNQKELIYMGTKYSIIRVQEKTADELALICERKLKNV